MAAQRTIRTRSLRFKIPVGLMDNGDAKIKTYSYGSIKLQATDEDLLKAASALASLMDPEPEFMGVVETAELRESL